MITISNTSPLIALSRINRLDLLRVFAPRILIPSAVAEELQAGARLDEPIIKALRAGGWLEVRPVTDISFLALLLGEIDRGEAEAVVLAFELKGTVLIDDRAGRSIAKRLNVDHVGTLGVISEAKRTGVIAAVAPLVTALLGAGIFYRPPLIDEFLRAHQEEMPP